MNRAEPNDPHRNVQKAMDMLVDALRERDGNRFDAYSFKIEMRPGNPAPYQAVENGEAFIDPSELMDDGMWEGPSEAQEEPIYEEDTPQYLRAIRSLLRGSQRP
jgi:hypothetical protein